MRLFITTVLLFCLITSGFCREQGDSLYLKNSIKVDLVPLYHVLFDTRVQIRSGFEYERYLSKKSSLGCYLDLGLYDKYDFIKYYDFFNQNQGLYSVKQHVTTIGFHLLPSWNYYFLRFGKANDEMLYLSGIADAGHYRKRTEQLNSLTLESFSGSFSQTRLGLGLGIGFKNYYCKHLFIELKTSLILKVYDRLSDNSKNPIKSLDSQWTSPNYKLWWISNIKFGYAF